MADPQKKPADDLVEVTVVRGTIRTGAYSSDRDKLVDNGPGAKVSVPRGELAALIARGIVADPLGGDVLVGPGPTFTPQGGPTITETGV